VPARATEQLAADGLAGQLAEAEQLVEAVALFEARLSRIQRALDALQADEEATAGTLVACCRHLVEIGEAIDLARPALDRKASRHLGTLHYLRRHGEALRDDVRRRDRGTVAGKVGRAERWGRAVRSRLRPLLRALEGEADAARRHLAQALEALRAVARLDGEPAVRQALAQLSASRPAARKVRGGHLASAVGVLDHARALLEDRAATWRARDALEADVRRRLEGPLAAWQRAQEAAAAAQEELSACERALAAAWPPLACDTRRTERLYGNIPRDERHLRDRARSAREAADQLQLLARAHEQAAAAAEATVRSARADQARLAAIAEAIDARLRALGTQRGADPDAAGTIDARLAAVERELARLRQRWRRRPPAFADARRELARIERKLEAVGR
jgi:DNA repair exonuclease SbcCD ATPase subunit